MMLLTPIASLLFLPFMLYGFWIIYQPGGAGISLPGSWRLVTASSLQRFMQRRLESLNDRSVQVAAICAVLIIVALTHPVLTTDTAPPVNFKARVLVLDMSAKTDVAAQRFVADALLRGRTGEAPVATGLVIVGDSAYTVVPVTTDLAHVDRYLGAATPELMPVNGRALHEGIAVAEALMADAEVVVGQVVVVTSGSAVTPLISIPQSGGLREIVVAAGEVSGWSELAANYRASLHTGNDWADVNARLMTAAAEQFFHGVRSSTIDLRPVLIGLSLLLWLWLLRPRSVF